MVTTVESLSAQRNVTVMGPAVLTVVFANASTAMRKRTVQTRNAPITAHLQVNVIQKQANASVIHYLLGQIAAQSYVQRTAVVMENAIPKLGHAAVRHHIMARLVTCSTVPWTTRGSTVRSRVPATYTQGSVFVTSALQERTAAFRHWDAKIAVCHNACVPKCAVAMVTATQTLGNVHVSKATKGLTVQTAIVLVTVLDMGNAMQLVQNVSATNCGIVQTAHSVSAHSTANKPMAIV